MIEIFKFLTRHVLVPITTGNGFINKGTSKTKLETYLLLFELEDSFDGWISNDRTEILKY